jgi:uncharacterized repeat protein (TIGR01451 family)
LVAVCLLTAALTLSQTLSSSGSAEASRPRGAEPDGAAVRLSEGYGELPLRFEANLGQTGRAAKFLARGSGYTLFLAETGAVLRLRGAEDVSGEAGSASDARDAARREATLRFRLEGANRSPKISGVGELPGKSNYLVGGDARRWQTGVPAFERVRYESVYPGIDAVYYGRQGRLEYDFNLAPGANPSRIRLAFDGARKLRIDEGGDLVITTDVGDVRQQRPVAYQERDGARTEVAARYRIDARGRVSFELGDYDRARSLVIDPVLVYSSYLGGIDADQGLSVAVDASGSAYVVGSTVSADFPVTGGLQPSKIGFTDAFVLKLSPDGKSLVYATYLGGNGDDFANAVAVDSDGNAYVGGFTGSGSFPTTPGSFQQTKDGVIDGFVAKLNSTGTALVYSTHIGGQGAEQVTAIAVDAAGAAYVAGHTESTHFTKAPGVTRAGSAIYKSTDGGASWGVSNAGLTASSVGDFAVAPSAPNVVYAAANLGVYRSADGGASWQRAGEARPSTAPNFTRTVVVDPTNSAVVYAATSNRGVLKSTDGGTNWTPANNGLTSFNPQPATRAIAFDPSNASTLYVVATSVPAAIYKSVDGGANWAYSSTGLRATFNGQNLTPSVVALLVDPASPSNVYAATNGFGVYKSTDGGANWSPSSAGLANRSVQAIAMRPGSPAAILAGALVGGDGFVVKLNPAGSLPEYLRMLGGSEFEDVRGVAVGAGGSAYVVGTTSSDDFPTANAFQPALGGSNDAFVMKLDAAGATLYSTYLGGANTDQGGGVAVGPDGAAYVTGGTSSTNFPTANALQPSMAEFDFSDAFVTKLAPSGQALVYSTYLGAPGSDQGLGIGVGADGSAYVAGGTGAANFPLVAPARGYGGLSDAFVARLNPAGSALSFSTYLGGAGNDQGNAVAVSPAGEIFVVGNTASTDFPVPGAVRGTYGGGRSDAFVAKFGPGIDLAVTMTDSPDPVAFGADLTYAIKVRNQGDLAATGVRLTDTLPAGASLVSAATDLGACSGAATIVCDIGTLAGGGEANVTVKIKPPAARTINNTATVTLNETDAVASNNSASAETTVDFADIAVTKSALYGNVAPGSKAVFIFTLTNKSGATVTSATLSDVLPAGLTFASCDAPLGGTCGGAGNSRTVTFNPLHAGQTVSATISAIVDAAAAAGTVYNNTATVSATFPDPDASNNTASAAVTARVFAPTARSNGKVVLAAGDGVYAVNPDGTGRTKLVSTPPGAADYDPVWSPDGTKIVFRRNIFGASFPETAHNFYVMDADGSNPRRVAGSNVDSRATWSPDGTHFAYVKFVTDFELYAARLDGTGEARIGRNLGTAHSFDWSPDGSRFVFRQSNLHIFVMDADGTNPRQLTNVQTTVGGTFDTDPLWSFDGARITFTRSVNNSFDLYVINADGTGLARILNQGGLTHGQLSPDGMRLVYQAGEGTGGVFVANVDGSGYPYSLGAGHDPSWLSLPNPNPTPTPAPVQTFSISGHVTAPDNFFFTAVRLTGTRTATASLDSAGNYTFINLPKGGTYTVTPLKDVVAFTKYTPGSRTVTDLQSDVTGLDFTGERVLHTIRGRVTDGAGNGLGGIRMVMTRGGQSETTTDAQGRYSFPTGLGGEFFTIQPFETFFSFDPVRAVLPPVTGDTTVNFVAVPTMGMLAIQGRVIDSSGNSVVGLPVTLSGGRRAAVRTDASGIYTFYNLPAGLTYTVTPSTADGLAFAPAQRTYPSLDGRPFDLFTASMALPTVQFAATAVSVAENARVVELTLTRGPDPQLAASVDFETSELNGSERSDYIAAFGTVRFGPGETSQKLRVLLTDDNLVEGERAFKVTLKGGRNLFIGAAGEAVVRITDDDAAASAANPLDSSAFFVAQHYADFLNRAPDAEGLAHWTNEIESCGADAQCREVRRVNVSAAFFLSIEFQETGYLAYKAHKVAFGTGEALAHKTFLKDTQAIGNGVVVGQGEWRALLDANKETYLNDFVLRPEFQLAYPQTMAPAQFVDTLHANAGVTLTQEERSALVSALTTGATTRAAVLRQVVENAEFSRREFNKAFVLTQYFGYLRRGPSEPPDSDFAGWQFWLGKLNEFDGNYIAAEMVKAFITSAEYRKRFGQ